MGKEVDDDKEDDREPEMVVIEEGSPEHQALQEREEDEDHEATDEGGDEERLGKSETTEDERQLYGRRRDGESDDQYRERRRKERKQKKANRQAAISRNRTELRYLESRNEVLERQNAEMQRRLVNVERGQTQTQVLTVDGRISQAEAQLNEAKQIKAAALDANNGTDVVKCDEIIDHLNNQIRSLKGYKEHLARGGQTSERDEEVVEQRQAARVQPPQDPKIRKHSDAFKERLDWFDPTGKDPESATVYAIDVALAKDSRFNPQTPQYWKELERRVRAALPHKFEEAEDDLDDDVDLDDDEPAARQSSKPKGPRLPGAGRATKGNNTFYLSAERKQAMLEAGVYDDPKLRAKYIKKYREWDQQNAGRK